MSNFINALAGGAVGFLTGGPVGAAAGLLGGLQGQNGNTTAGNLANAGASLLNQKSELDNLALMNENMRHQSMMQWQSMYFDEMMDEKSEKMREMNSLRDLDMEQRKADNQITKKFITSVTE
ncbi:MAG: hypothetical protein M3N19_11070 [Candidatus Eremiobacteraeota bacterium]|nr:hypothetical protein [Candidatus Eremiobacteraeota bacterium]